jgi:probable dihydroxyacetone kinase regulator
VADANITKGSLARAMKQLMSEKSFAKISITDICDLCGMNRKSFYYHFKDKYDLMNWIFYTEFIVMVSNGSYENGWDLLEAVCELLYKDKGFYRAALRTEGQNSFREFILESMNPIINFLFDDMLEAITDVGLTGKMFCEMYLIAVSNWMEDGCKSTPAEFTNSIKQLIKKLAASIED